MSYTVRDMLNGNVSPEYQVIPKMSVQIQMSERRTLLVFMLHQQSEK